MRQLVFAGKMLTDLLSKPNVTDLNPDPIKTEVMDFLETWSPNPVR
jgi:hypothetical protein